MNNTEMRRRLTGVASVAWVVVTGIGVVLFSVAGTPPAFEEAHRYAQFTSASAGLFVTDAFTTGVSAALLVVVIAGLRAILDEILILAFGLMGAAILLMVGTAELVTVYVSTSSSYWTLTAPLWLLTQSAIVFLYFPATGLFAATAWAVWRTGVMPRWSGGLAAGVAALVAVSSLAVFGGTGPFGPLGLLQVLLGFLPSALAVLVFGVILLQRGPHGRTGRADETAPPGPSRMASP